VKGGNKREVKKKMKEENEKMNSRKVKV